jgi:hypothetical protein
MKLIEKLEIKILCCFPKYRFITKVMNLMLESENAIFYKEDELSTSILEAAQCIDIAEVTRIAILMKENSLVLQKHSTLIRSLMEVVDG